MEPTDQALAPHIGFNCDTKRQGFELLSRKPSVLGQDHERRVLDARLEVFAGRIEIWLRIPPEVLQQLGDTRRLPLLRARCSRALIASVRTRSAKRAHGLMSERVFFTWKARYTDHPNRGITMPNAVNTGCMMKCSFGAAPSSLLATPGTVTAANMPMATIMDNKPMMNIPHLVCACRCPTRRLPQRLRQHWVFSPPCRASRRQPPWTPGHNNNGGRKACADGCVDSDVQLGWRDHDRNGCANGQHRVEIEPTRVATRGRRIAVGVTLRQDGARRPGKGSQRGKFVSASRCLC